MNKLESTERKEREEKKELVIQREIPLEVNVFF